MDYLIAEAKRLDADLWAATDPAEQIKIYERIQRNRDEIRDGGYV